MTHSRWHLALISSQRTELPNSSLFAKIVVEIHSEDIFDTDAVIMCATVFNCVYCVLFVILRQLCFIL